MFQIWPGDISPKICRREFLYRFLRKKPCCINMLFFRIPSLYRLKIVAIKSLHYRNRNSLCGWEFERKKFVYCIWLFLPRSTYLNQSALFVFCAVKFPAYQFHPALTWRIFCRVRANAAKGTKPIPCAAKPYESQSSESPFGNLSITIRGYMLPWGRWI